MDNDRNMPAAKIIEDAGLTLDLVVAMTRDLGTEREEQAKVGVLAQEWERLTDEVAALRTELAEVKQVLGGVTVLLRHADAERDAMRPVVEAAIVLVDAPCHKSRLGAERKIDIAVDVYREATRGTLESSRSTQDE